MVIRIKKTAHHKRHSPKKYTKKMKGGALTPRQTELLRMLSKIITWGSLGFITFCTAMPLIKVILGLLYSAGLDTMTSSFYELIWVNLSSTMSSLYSAAGSASVAALDGLNVLARAGNLCAAIHATVRLANPIYSFALGGIQHFIEIMKNPLNFNQTINRFLSEQKGIIDNFLGDYYALGRNAQTGIKATAAAERELYDQMKRLINDLGSELKEKMPKRSDSELAARDANLQWLANCEDFVFSILSTGMEGANYISALSARHKDKVYQCARGTMGAAKDWISYLNDCGGNTIQYINKRKRGRSSSPKGSPPPSPKEMEVLATTMMTQTLPEEEASQYEDADEILPNQEVAVMLRGISPEPAQIKGLVREFNACPRRASAPPEGDRPTLKARRRHSIGPSVIKKPIPAVMDAIAESPEEENTMKKMKREGGRKTRKRVHFKKRRGTRKL